MFTRSYKYRLKSSEALTLTLPIDPFWVPARSTTATVATADRTRQAVQAISLDVECKLDSSAARPVTPRASQ